MRDLKENSDKSILRNLNEYRDKRGLKSFELEGGYVLRLDPLIGPKLRESILNDFEEKIELNFVKIGFSHIFLQEKVYTEQNICLFGFYE